MKQVSFRVYGEGDDVGIVILPIIRAIESSYTVTLDGNVTTNFKIINNETNNEANIKISDDHGVHVITI